MVPDPDGRALVGDVGEVKQGDFLRIFNALLPANDTAQVYDFPDGFVLINVAR